MALLLTLFSSSAWSQAELTVYDGTTTSQYVPAYIYYFDDFSRSQCVFPAANLADMKNGTITAIKFYTTSGNVPYTTASAVDVYLKEVDYTSISAYEETSSCTTIYQGTLSIVAEGDGGSLTIELATPFAYKGGNLLIGIENTTDAEWKNINFYGQTVAGASVAGSNGNSLDAVSPNQRNFLPKTTFVYTLNGIQVPKNITVSNMLYNQVDIDWTDINGAGTTWEIAYCEDMGGFEPGDDGDVITNVTSKPYTLTGLKPETTYEVSVRAINGTDMSDWCFKNPSTRETYTFTTPTRFVVPTNLEANNITTTTADVSWTPTIEATSYNLRYQECGVPSTATITLTADDVWGDGSGYQMLLDPTASTYGTTIPTTGALTASGNADASVYDQFEYKIPTDADGSLITSHIVANGASVTIEVPAGTYDWCITNPTPGDRMWIASAGGSAGGRIDDYVFEAGKIYEFHVYLGDDGYDAVDVTITDNLKGIDPAAWIVINGASNPQELTGLNPDTYYAVEVQGVYDSTESEWSTTVFFQTEAEYVKPQNLTVEEVKAEEATLSWVAGQEDQTAWDVAYMADGDADFTIISGVTTTTYTLTGLTPETAYTVKVRGNHGEGEYSQWTNAKTFTTFAVNEVPFDLVADNITHTDATLSWTGAQDAYTLRYRTAAYKETLFTQDFEDGLGEWQAISNNTNNDAKISSDAAMNGSYGFRFSSWSSVSAEGQDYNQYLISPSVTGATALKFFYSTYGQYGPETFEVGYSTTGSDVDDFTWDATTETSSSTTSWTEFTCDIPDGTEYVAIHYTSNWCAYLYIDNISVLGNEQPAGEWQTVPYQVEPPYDLADLEMDTEYEWQVMGNDPDTDWSESAFFTTLDENTKFFIADGDWDDENNWFPVGVPTEDSDVTIQADATVPAGVIAYAKTITMDGGSITLKDLAELKTETDGVPVTIERDINAEQYYLLSSPIYADGVDFDDVQNMISSNYDIYEFVASQDFEWINEKSHSMVMASTEGFLYANADAQTLTFTGTALASINNYDWNTVDFDDSETDFYNGWNLVGNPFPCTAYLYCINGSGSLQDAYFYKLNEMGTFDVYEYVAALAPGESVFMQVFESSLYYYISSENLGYNPDDYYLGEVDYPSLPAMWEDEDQDAAPYFWMVDDDDNTDMLSYIDGYSGINVGIYGRTLYTDGRWNTLCLPFETIIEGSPIEGASARYLNAASVDEKVLTLNFEEDVTLFAGTPYIMKWESPISDNIENPVFFFGYPVEVNASPTFEEVDGIVTFVGTYAPVTFNDEDHSVLLMGSDSNLFYPDGLEPSWVNAFRGYFQLNDEYKAGNKITGVKMNFDDEATGIYNLTQEQTRGQGETYDLSGRRVSTPSKGMYIQNGKKVLIK